LVKPEIKTLPMLVDPPDQIVRDAEVERTMTVLGKNVDLKMRSLTLPPWFEPRPVSSPFLVILNCSGHPIGQSYNFTPESCVQALLDCRDKPGNDESGAGSERR